MTRNRAAPLLLLLAAGAVMAAPGPFVLPAVVAAGLAVTGLRAARALGLIRRRTRAPSEAAIELGSDQASRRVWIAEGELASHGLILGASGAGKTTTLLRILTEQVKAAQPVVAIDMKGSPAFAAALAVAAAEAGRPFKRWTMEGGSHWNPLRHGNPTELKDKLIATERFSEPHYQRAAERYLQMALGALQAAHPERPPTLADVVRVMDPRRLPVLLRELPRHLADPMQDYLAGLRGDQQSAVRGLQTRLALITESAAGKYLAPAASDHEEIDLRSALRGPDVVLFSLNSSTYGKLASQLGTLVVQDLVSVLGRQLDEEGGGRRATIAIDEFSGLGGDHVVALFARVREAGGGVLVATQEMADLDRAASGLRDQVVGNTAFKLVHRQDVPASARMVAQMAGTERRWEETRLLGGGFFGGASGRGTRRQVDRFVLDPNEIMSLRTGEAAVISKLRGERPRIVRVERGGAER